MIVVDRKKFRIALIERDTAQWKVGAQLGHNPNAFSLMLNGRLPAPAGLRERIEDALCLERGALAP